MSWGPFSAVYEQDYLVSCLISLDMCLGFHVYPPNPSGPKIRDSIVLKDPTVDRDRLVIKDLRS